MSDQGSPGASGGVVSQPSQGQGAAVAEDPGQVGAGGAMVGEPVSEDGGSSDTEELACIEATAATKLLLSSRCATCHSPAGAMSRDVFGDLLDADALKASGRVMPGNPDGSVLLMRVQSDAMPPNNPKLSDEEKGSIRSWITCGAPSWEAPVETPVDECAQLPKAIQAIFIEYCDDCHGSQGDSAQSGGFDFSDSVPAMLASPRDLLVPGDPDASKMFTRSDGFGNRPMPPPEYGKSLLPADVAAIRHWIECGPDDWDAPEVDGEFSFVTINARLNAILQDLESLPEDEDRLAARYIDLSTLANAGLSGPQIQVYREAVSMLVNSVSRGRQVVSPTPVDDQQLIYRIDLEDYAWDAARWREVEAAYPYAVRYTGPGPLAGDEGVAEAIRTSTDTAIPYVQADWFIAHASRPPLYTILLDLPDNLNGLQRDLGIDIANDLAGRRVRRAGFSVAGPTPNYRIIERHALTTRDHSLWATYDFSGMGSVNVFGDPLVSQQEGAAFAFNLRNGLLGYFLADAAGNRVDRAPDALLRDPLAPDGVLENGLSCMNCHQEQGIVPARDEVREFALATAEGEILQAVSEVYPTQAELDATLAADSSVYVIARDRIFVRNLSNTTLHSLDKAHRGPMRLGLIAATLGLSAIDLQRALDTDRAAFPAALRLLGEEDTIPRVTFESFIPEILTALQLGEPLAPR